MKRVTNLRTRRTEPISVSGIYEGLKSEDLNVRAAAVLETIQQVKSASQNATEQAHLHDCPPQAALSFPLLAAHHLADCFSESTEIDPHSQELSWIVSAISPAICTTLEDLMQHYKMALLGELEVLDTRKTAALCFAGLEVTALLACDCAADTCLQAALAFAAGAPVPPALSARSANQLRESSCRALAAFSPDCLFSLWKILGGPDADKRRKLLPVLDYMHDGRAVPYLMRLLSRCPDWPDGTMTAWFLVRTLEHIGDPIALQHLRMFLDRCNASGAGITLDNAPDRQLIGEVERVISALQRRAGKRENRSLLRPSAELSAELLHPATAEARPSSTVADLRELLRAAVPEPQDKP